MILHAHAERGLPGYPWLVFLHGFAGDSLEWRAVGQAFGAYPRLYIDLPGHGGSADRAVNRFTDVSELIKNTLISYNMHKYWLVGYSSADGWRCIMPASRMRGSAGWSSREGIRVWRTIISVRSAGAAMPPGLNAFAESRLRRSLPTGISSRSSPPGRSAACGAGCATQLQQRQGVSRDAAGLLTG